ncbi:MAG: gamma-mobile-trio protein GmtX [Pedobacter sp.]
MSKMTMEQAKIARIESIMKAKENIKIRSDTRRKMDLVDKTCSTILERGRPFSVPEVVRVMKEKFPGDALSHSSISNQTTSGDAYKEVILAWKNYAEITGFIKPVTMPATAADDITDLTLSQIKPKELRPTILAMRTSLRNARKQLQMHQIATPSRLLNHEETIESGTIKETGDIRFNQSDRLSLTNGEVEILEAFINPVELGAFGLNWNKFGQLMNDCGEIISRTGLRDVIEKILKIIKQ